MKKSICLGPGSQAGILCLVWLDNRVGTALSLIIVSTRTLQTPPSPPVHLLYTNPHQQLGAILLSGESLTPLTHCQMILFLYDLKMKYLLPSDRRPEDWTRGVGDNWENKTRGPIIGSWRLTKSSIWHKWGLASHWVLLSESGEGGMVKGQRVMVF